MKKKHIITLVLLAALIFMPTFMYANTLSSAQVDARAFKDNLPVQVVKGTDFPMYEHEGEEVFDFRAYFEIMDQRTDILRMNHLVDGFLSPIDLGGYVWDFGGFNVDEVGLYTISIAYTGINGVRVPSSQVIEVIEEDLEAPKLWGFTPTRILSKGASFEDFIRILTATDNVDGLIELTLDHFSGHENIETAELETEHVVTITVVDNAGNETIYVMTIIIKDTSAPVILGLTKNVETVVNKPVDYKSHLTFVDNNDTEDEIIVVYEGEPDFTKSGIYEIRVTATDQSGNSYSGTFNIIVKEPITLFQIVLLANASGLVIAGVVIGALVIFNKREKKEVEVNEE